MSRILIIIGSTKIYTYHINHNLNLNTRKVCLLGLNAFTIFHGNYNNMNEEISDYEKQSIM